MTVRPIAARAIVALPILVVVVSHLWLMPIWDGLEYAQCVFWAIQPNQQLAQLNCFGHVAIGYTAPVALGALFAPGSYVPILLVNAALGVSAVLAFLRIAEWLVPGEEFVVERLLATLALSCAPVFACSALNLTPDYGLCVFFLWTVAALVSERPLLVAISGTLLVLSKEPGIALYVLPAFFYVALVRRRLPSILEAALGLVPVAALVAVKLWQAQIGQGAWGKASTQDLLELAVTFRFNARFTAYLFLIFGFQFLWISSAVATGLFARLRDRKVQYVLALVLSVTYTGTRFLTFLNARYVVFAVPAVLLAALGGAAAIRAPVVRRTILGASVAAAAVSLFTSADPLSRGFFGTFDLGGRALFDMTRPTREQVGHGRDQLVYNLQFVAFDRLLEQVLQDKKPQLERPLVIPADQNWFLLADIDPATYRRTLAPREPRPWLSTPALIGVLDPPPQVSFVAFSNTDYRRDVRVLSSLYDVTATRTYDWHGYSVEVADLSLR